MTLEFNERVIEDYIWKNVNPLTNHQKIVDTDKFDVESVLNNGKTASQKFPDSLCDENYGLG